MKRIEGIQEVQQDGRNRAGSISKLEHARIARRKNIVPKVSDAGASVRLANTERRIEPGLSLVFFFFTFSDVFQFDFNSPSRAKSITFGSSKNVPL